MQGRNCKFLIVPVNFIVAQNKRKRIKLFSAELFSCKLSDKFKLLIGQNILFFFRDYSPLLIFSACAL